MNELLLKFGILDQPLNFFAHPKFFWPIVAFAGVIFAFAVTCVAISKFSRFLPKDMGRQFAHDGKLSAGKPRGAGIIFIFVFVLSAVLFAEMNIEIGIYLILIVIEMLTGYFDDAAEKPWGEYLKGFLDLVVAVIAALVYLHFNSSEIYLAIFDKTLFIPPVVFATYPEVIANNMDDIFAENDVKFSHPFLPYDNDLRLAEMLTKEFASMHIPKDEIVAAVSKARKEQKKLLI